MISAEAFRAAALALPEAVERETWTATFRVGDKMFAALWPDELTACLKSTLAEQAELVAERPETFSVGYLGKYGWVLVRLSTVDPGELRELLAEAWRRAAPRRLLSGP